MNDEPIETLSGDPTLVLPELEAPPEDPLPLLDRWLRLADERGVREPRALALATADAAGRPSSRIVLLKQLSPAVVFAGSYESRKGRDLATARSPCAAPHAGAATGSTPTWSSSGTAAPTASTGACCTRRRASAGRTAACSPNEFSAR